MIVKLPIRVVLLDEADGLTSEAQEFLRRPMECFHSIVIVFTANDERAISRAIKDRCTVLYFHALQPNEIKRGLERIIAAEGVKIREDELREIISKAGGSMRKAISLLQEHHCKEAV